MTSLLCHQRRGARHYFVRLTEFGHVAWAEPAAARIFSPERGRALTNGAKCVKAAVVASGSPARCRLDRDDLLVLRIRVEVAAAPIGVARKGPTAGWRLRRRS